MTTSKDLQLQTTRLEADLQPINDELDTIYSQFAVALVPNVTKWMNTHVAQKIEINATKINEGGIEPLRLIKAELAQLIERLPEICNAAIETPDRWPHRTEVTISRDLRRTPTAKSHAEESFRRAINPVGLLISKHGLRQPQKGYAEDWKSTGGNEYKYAFGVQIDVRDYPVLQEYEAKRKHGAQLQETITAKKKELEKTKARELWDDA